MKNRENKRGVCLLLAMTLALFSSLNLISCDNRKVKTATSEKLLKTKDIAMMVNLVDDSTAIAPYENYHDKAWPEVIAANEPANILGVKIYRLGSRLVMILTVPENWDGDKDNKYVKSSPKVKEWLDIMEKFQEASPEAPVGTKDWAPMKLVFGYQNGKQVYK